MRTTRLDKICHDLNGTSADLDDTLETSGMMFESLSIDEHLYIDSKVMCCDTCGYWNSACDVDTFGVCNECNDDARATQELY
jgi:hypothetical protein